jgi:hypothetical protein
MKGITVKGVDADKHYEEFVVKMASPVDKNSFEVTSSMGWSLWVPNKKHLPLPGIGERGKCFGKGHGFPIRGLQCGERVYFYSTEKQFEKDRLKQIDKDKEKRKAKFQKGRKKFDARVKALPKEFQERMARFMKRKDWDWEFGDYELFVCEDAVKLARSCNMSIKELKKFYKLGHEAQMKIAEKAGVRVGDHSGNTYAMAVNLAWLYIDRPTYVVKMHGAMCPLVGCQGYGCWTATHKKGKK